MWPDARRAFEWEAPLPLFRRVQQEFPRPRVEDLASTIAGEMDRLGGAEKLGGGRSVAITAGSRGIVRIAEVIAGVARRVRDYGGEPFIVPAMGSHGGATAEGQTELLASLGITEESTGVPIHSSIDVVKIGELPNGMPVYSDRLAASADAIVIVNRVKPHTDFRGELESGLAKMAVIGLGKPKGADTLHRYGVTGLQELMPQAARLVVSELPVAMGIAVIQNAYDEVAVIGAVPPDGIGGAAEAGLLKVARELMPCLPFDEIDVLIVDEMGKNISGAGLDTNVIGRVKVHGVQNPPRPVTRTIVVLGLTPESHGNAVGLGLAEVTTRRVVEQIDFEAFYINGLTSGITGIQRSALPVIAPDDRAAIMAALRSCGRHDTAQARVVRIKNTLQVDEIDVSESLLEDATFKSQSEPFSLPFDEDRSLVPFDETVPAGRAR